MPKRNILLLDKKESPWFGFLEEFFEDTSSKSHSFHDASAAGSFLERSPIDVLFINPELLSLPLSQKLKVLTHHSPGARIFRLGFREGMANIFPFEDGFDQIPSLVDFQKQLVQHLPLIETIRVLVIDDEHEIGGMIMDFLDRRVHPAFEVEYVDNGAKGLEALAKKIPDVIVLDIKMPVKDGREVYREIKKRGLEIPVIIFFDAISGDEMVEIHKYGRPAVVEKGARQSAMPEMMTLIKKLAYFG